MCNAKHAGEFLDTSTGGISMIDLENERILKKLFGPGDLDKEKIENFPSKNLDDLGLTGGEGLVVIEEFDVLRKQLETAEENFAIHPTYGSGEIHRVYYSFEESEWRVSYHSEHEEQLIDVPSESPVEIIGIGDLEIKP